MSILSNIERTINVPIFPVVADGLCYGQDVCLGKCAMDRRAAMSTGAEADQLIGVIQV